MKGEGIEWFSNNDEDILEYLKENSTDHNFMPYSY
jgi:hypothetical protein